MSKAKINKLLAGLPAFRSLTLAFEAGCEDVGSVADRLGRLAAVRAEIEGYEEKLKEIVIENGEKAVEGRLFRSTLSIYDQTRLDTKLIREKMKPAWLKRFSLPTQTITKVLTKARIGAALEESVKSAA